VRGSNVYTCPQTGLLAKKVKEEQAEEHASTAISRGCAAAGGEVPDMI